MGRSARQSLAVDAVDTAYALVLRRVLLAHGLDMDRGDYTLIAKGTTGYRLDSMIQGETFAGVFNPPWDRKAAAAGMVRFADHREVLPDYPGGVFAVSRALGERESRSCCSVICAPGMMRCVGAREENHRDEAIKASGCGGEDR